MSARSSLFTLARLIGLALAIAIACIDQAVKWLVTVPLGLDRAGAVIELLPFFDLTYTRNYGISLGMLEATSMEMRWLLVALTAGIALVVLVWMMREKLLGDILGLALILGGALGNIYDRYRHGYVIDYADLHIGTFRPFLIFNIADAAITIGVVVILARALFFGEKGDDTQKDTSDPALEN
ncbi:MAG: signal peptidase II [Pseudomonadota bacterium]